LPADRTNAKGRRAEALLNDLRRRRLSHDIRHQLSTVVLLASTLSTSNDVGAAARARSAQLVEEARWLAELFRVYDRDVGAAAGPEPVADGGVRLDIVAADVLRPIRMSSDCDITFEAGPVTALAHRLGAWRAVRNIVDNALAAAGPDGRLIVRVFSEAGRAVVEVHDSGPGFEAKPPSPDAHGLDIVRAFVRVNGGSLTIGRGALDGCVVRLDLPEQV
jgi:signal transduction histidine kinase